MVLEPLVKETQAAAHQMVVFIQRAAVEARLLSEQTAQALNLVMAVLEQPAVLPARASPMPVAVAVAVRCKVPQPELAVREEALMVETTLAAQTLEVVVVVGLRAAEHLALAGRAS